TSTSVTELTKTTSQVQTASETALTEVRSAKSTAEEARSLATQASTGSTEAQKTSEQALREATSAKATADLASTAANDAKGRADEAKTTSEEAKTLAQESKNVCAEAKQTVADVKVVAEKALSTAHTVQQTCDERNRKVSEALTQSSEAKTLAEQANAKAASVEKVTQETKESLDLVNKLSVANSELVKDLVPKVSAIYRPVINDVAFAQPQRFLEASVRNRRAVLLHKGTYLRFFSDDNDRYPLYYVTENKYLDLPESCEAGKDYYIYMTRKFDSDDISFHISDNGNLKDTDTVQYSKILGGFHTLCADVGIIEGHQLSGLKAGDVLPYSVWCLNHRPYSDPEGMVYNPDLDIWVDIYLQSGTGYNTRSAYGVPVITNREYSSHAHDLLDVGKRLLTDEEFVSSMAFSNSNTFIAGDQEPSPKHSGGHVDTENRRMISWIGCEDACGYLWQFLSGCYPVLHLHQSDTEEGESYYYSKEMAMLAGGCWGGDRSHYLVRSFSHGRYETSEKITARGCSHSCNFTWITS
ncbi:hypothetical protein, partial [Bartonella rattimassiliensis]